MSPDSPRFPTSPPSPGLPGTHIDVEATQAEEASGAAEPVLDEIDVDLGEPDAPDLPGPVAPFADGAEYLGSYSSIPAYFRAMLEPEVSTACGWILAHLDSAAIQRRWESDGSRLVLARGNVYRLISAVPADDPHRSPKP